MLSRVRAAIIVELIASYEFDIGEFLAQEIRNQVVVSDKFLLAYPCIITQMCIAVGV